MSSTLMIAPEESDFLRSMCSKATAACQEAREALREAQSTGDRKRIDSAYSAWAEAQDFSYALNRIHEKSLGFVQV